MKKFVVIWLAYLISLQAFADIIKEDGVIIHRHQNHNQNAIITLLVSAGSMNETEDQRGYAHIVEHMAFIDSKKYPNESLFKEFKKLGIEFGQHANAHTHLTHTEYQFEIKNADDKKIKKAIEIMSQFALHVRFDETLLAKELKIIEQERLFRKERQGSYQEVSINRLYDSAGINAHYPIGTEQSIKNATVSTIKAFYDRWYQPENMQLIVTGNINEHLTKKYVHKYFSETLLGKNFNNEVILNPENIEKYSIIHDKNILGSQLEMHWIVDVDKSSKKAFINQFLDQDAAIYSLKKRLEKHLINPNIESVNVYSRPTGAHQEIITAAIVTTGPYTEELSKILKTEINGLKDGISKEEYKTWITDNAKQYIETDNNYSLIYKYKRNKINGIPLYNYKERISAFNKKRSEKSTQTSNQYINNWLSQPETFVFVSFDKLSTGSIIKTDIDKYQNVKPEIIAQETIKFEIPNKRAEPASFVEKKINDRITSWEFSNGIKVMYRKAAIAKQNVSYQLMSNSGFKKLTATEIINQRLIIDHFKNMSIEGYSLKNIQAFKAQQDINESLGTYFGYSMLSGELNRKNIDQGLKLLAARINQNKIEPAQWQATENNTRQLINQQKNQSNSNWSTLVYDKIYANHIAYRPLIHDDLKQADITTATKLANQMLGDEPVLVITGNLNKDKLKTILINSVAQVENLTPNVKNIAELPKIQQGQFTAKGSQQERIFVTQQFSIDKNTVLDRYNLRAYGQWIANQLFKDIRENQGLVYTIEADIRGVENQSKEYVLNVRYYTSEENLTLAQSGVNKIINRLKEVTLTKKELKQWQKSYRHTLWENTGDINQYNFDLATLEQYPLTLDQYINLSDEFTIADRKKFEQLSLKFSNSVANSLSLTWLP